MTFPVTVKHRRAEAIIYGKSKAYPYYRLAYRSAGKRIVRSFPTYAAAKTEAQAKVRELAAGKQSVALTTKEAADALAIRDALQAFKEATGRQVTAIQAVTGFLDAIRPLPADQNLSDAVNGYLRTVASVSRTPLSDAVAAFCKAREAKTVAAPGKRPALNPVYVADTTRHLKAFDEAFPATAVADLTKAHLDAFLGNHDDLSPKSRNHLRATLRMFLRWCVRRDYLPTNTRLLEADGFRKETPDDKPIDFYRPNELRALLKKATGSMRAVIAIQGLAGLRMQEVLRLDWKDVFGIEGHIEVSSAKSKTRQRRLVEIVPALEAWLAPYRGSKGQVSDETVSTYTHAFRALRKKLKIPSRGNGLRHGFVTYHYALHANENQTAAQAGNTPGMLHAHYKGLATKAEAEKWFDVRPS